MDMIANRPVLDVRGLTKRFGGLTAVKNLGFEVNAGEIFGLIGPNGSGKSTAMKSVMGIERPTSGEVIFEGENVAGLPAHKIARKGFGMVFQHSRPLNRQTVLENIMVALLPDSLFMLFPDKALVERAKWIADRVGLGSVMNRRPPTLPFADLRRLELAKAIARDPKVVLVDEPFAGLTRAEVDVFSDLIRSFRDEGRAVMLVDHNVKSVAALVDRVLAMYLGEEIVTGKADDVMKNETVRRVYLGGAIETHARPETSFKDKVPLLQVENVSVFYGKAQALENVSIHVHEGEFVSVVGLNGAGKTTLFNTISGFLPYSGEIVRSGAKLRGTSPAKIARSGLVQCPESRELFGEMSVRENLDLGGQHLSDDKRAAQLAWLFELFPILKERQGQMAQTLSGGEQQMLAIGRALMMQPQILILDEPTLGLAPVILEQLSKALTKLRQTTAITVLLGEQNVTFALPACRPRLCAGARPHRLGGRSRPLRERSRRRFSLSPSTSIKNIERETTMRPSILGSSLLTSALALCLAAPAYAQSNDPIKIGVIAEVQSIAGAATPGGAQIAADEINAKGGILGRKVEIVTYDNKSSSADSVRAFQRAVSEDKVSAVIASYISEVVLALEPWAARLKMPLITPGAASNEITKAIHNDYEKNKYTFHGYLTSAAQAQLVCDAAKDLLVDKLKFKTVAIMSEDAAWTKPLDVGYEACLPKAGLKVVEHVRFSPDTTDFTPIFNNIEGKKPDVIVTGISHVGVQPTVQWKNQQVPIPMFGISAQALSPTFWKDTNGAADGVPSLAVATPDVAVTSKTKPFAAAFKAKFGTPPAYTGYTAYDEVYFITEAIKRAGSTDPDKMVAELEKTDYEGTIGRIQFYGKDDEFTHGIKSGPTTVSGLVFQWQDSKQVVVWPEKIAEGKLKFPAFVKLSQ
ncbi:ABC-type branched-subunit amino acid transport system ATPase component/ABC-type branched-subunit amino acid transport system substrate-binding protein [Bradyrhizobium sp. i1.3.1]